MAVVEFKFKSDHGYSQHELGAASCISVADLKQAPRALGRRALPRRPALRLATPSLQSRRATPQAITALKNIPAAFGLVLTNAQTGEGQTPGRPPRRSCAVLRALPGAA